MNTSRYPGSDFSCALLEVHVEHATILAIEGQSIVLPVWYASNSQQKPYITWIFQRMPSKQVQILKYLGGLTEVEEPQFKGRIDFVYPMPSKNISIIINNTREIDSGQYKCHVNVPDDSSSGGGNIGEINVTVLVLPSIPTCKIVGKPYIGSNVTLGCKSSSGKPAPIYSWIRTAPSTQIYFPPVQDTVKGTLSLTNLTTEMAGIYVCTSTNIAGISKCNITVEVTSFSRTAVIIGAVVGSIAGACCLAIMLVVLIYFCRIKKKDSPDEIENEIKEDAQAPKTLSWAKGNEADMISKNGTLSSVNTHRDHKSYPSKSPSDTASVITAAGSNLGFKPNYTNERGGITPTPSLSSQSLPTYIPPQNGSYYHTALPTNRNTLQRTNGLAQQVPRQGPNITSGVVTPSNLVRMGGVPVMVPAQSQAGSLV
ncbi:endothelial cell-selective adhesion molecule isoform X2 [Ascaphus truei]|uniref:endothelial cell-selective adhesion molecule isoform X2 n=1 Tax=Ascaphus truei TaxID=8439 RepID=UPI003F5A64B9